MPDLDQFIDGLADDLQPVRRINPVAARLGFAGVALASLLAALLAWGVSAPLAELHPSQAAILSAGLFFLLGVAAGTALTRTGRPGIERPGTGWRWVAAGVALLPVTALLWTSLFGAPWTGTSLADGIDCLIRGLTASLATAAAMTWWLRRGAPLVPARAGWLIGLSSGAVGALAVALTCPDQALTHIGLWHVAIIAAAALAGRLVVTPVLRW